MKNTRTLMTTLSLSLVVISTLAQLSGSQFISRFSSQNNLEQFFSAKTGMFQCADPGMSLVLEKQKENNLIKGIYFFMLTVSTYEGKHCHLNIKKNAKTVASLKDNQVSLKRRDSL